MQFSKFKLTGNRSNKIIGKIFTGRMKFLLEFLAVASLLFVVFYFGQGSYTLLLKEGMSEYYYTFKSIFGLQVPQHIYSDILLIQALSFFALTLVTPKVPLKRKIKFLLAGVAIFFILDLFFAILDLTFQSSETLILLAADFLKLALPFALWFAFSYNYLLRFFDERFEDKK
jgi:hypothetical protein